MMPNTTMTIIKEQQQKLAAATNKITKIRRTRQPKNPQLSVARRNERERNRVKMVNNGFALLREHLPIEDLHDCCEQSGSDTPTPDNCKKGGGAGNCKTKKYSKVETLRAAIQRIRMLEELIRSTEPGFESINIQPTSNSNSYDLDEPLSCSGSSSLSPATVSTTTTAPQLYHQNAQHQTMLDANNTAIYTTNQQGQFIKLEPTQQQTSYQHHHHQHQQHLLHLNQMPSPQESQTSSTHHSGLNYNQQMTNQVQQEQNNAVQQLTSSQNEVIMATMDQSQQQVPSHTHLWIQQHQSSFMEQQQATIMNENNQTSNNEWYSQSQQFIQSQSVSSSSIAPQSITPTESITTTTGSSQQQHHQNKMEEYSPVWFNHQTNADALSPLNQSQPAQSPVNNNSQQLYQTEQQHLLQHHHHHNHHHHQQQQHHHQISLYSQ